jgi:Photosynthesis system II assembly factor YCF48/Putative zinc-finger
MTDVPKFVLERLRKGEVTAHPEADVLAAFAEKSLSEREQTSVLAHLATCSDCREVLALAAEAEPEVSATEVRRDVPATSWVRWPVLRWGAAAACVVIVGAAVLYQSGSIKQQEIKGATSDAQPSVTATATVPAQAESAKNSAKENYETDSADRKVKVEDRLLARSPSIAPSAKPNRSLAEGRVVANKEMLKGGAPSSIALSDEAKSRDDLAKTKRVDAPSMREKVEDAAVAQGGPKKGEAQAQEKSVVAGGALPSSDVENEKDQSGVRLADKKTANAVAAAPAAPAPVQTAKAPAELRAEKQDEGTAVGKASETVEVSAAATEVSTDQNLQATEGTFAKLVVAMWNVNAAGIVSRSFDGGKKWQPVAIDSRTKFTVVASSGNSVWAGGNGGALYHSTNGGAQWNKVTPTDGAQTLTSDISRIQFDDLQHGTVFAGQERWTTSDGGKRWSRSQ